MTTSGLKVRGVIQDCFAGCYSFFKIVYFSVVYCKDQSYGMAAEESWIVLPILVPVSDLSSVCSVLQISALLKHSIPKETWKKNTQSSSSTINPKFVSSRCFAEAVKKDRVI